MEYGYWNPLHTYTVFALKEPASKHIFLGTANVKVQECTLNVNRLRFILQIRIVGTLEWHSYDL